MRPRQVIDALELDGEIAPTRGALRIGELTVPLADVGVVVLGAHARISGGALSLLAKYQIVVLNCDWRGVPNLIGYGWSSNSRVAARHRAQANVGEPKRKRAWQALVKAKLIGQSTNLQLRDPSLALRLRNMAASVRSGDPENLEAQGARFYWQRVFGEPFGRTPRSEEPANACLNYGYAVMRGVLIRAICEAGLSPTLGLWHRNRSNTFCLADDLIEPFRPAVDAVVQGLPVGSSPEQRDVKRSLVAVLVQPMTSDGTTVNSSAYRLAQNLARYLEGHEASLDVPVWKHPERVLDG